MKYLFSFIFSLAFVYSSNAQEFKYDPDLSRYNYKGYTLNFQDLTDKFNPKTKQRFVEAFYEIYPKIVAEFKPNAPKEITLMIDSLLNEAVDFSGSTIRFHPKWFEMRPEDIDVLTFHLMTILQAYNNYQAPFWLSTGISDYVRYKYGVNNKAANWALSKPLPFEKYTFGIRTTARFLVWLEKWVKPGFVKKLYNGLDKKPYDNLVWKELTGKSLEELWSKYIEHPEL